MRILIWNSVLNNICPGQKKGAECHDTRKAISGHQIKNYCWFWPGPVSPASLWTTLSVCWTMVPSDPATNLTLQAFLLLLDDFFYLPGPVSPASLWTTLSGCWTMVPSDPATPTSPCRLFLFSSRNSRPRYWSSSVECCVCKWCGVAEFMYGFGAAKNECVYLSYVLATLPTTW